VWRKLRGSARNVLSLDSLSLSLSTPLPLSLSLSPSPSLPLPISLSLSPSPSLPLSLSLSLSPPPSLPLSLFRSHSRGTYTWANGRFCIGEYYQGKRIKVLFSVSSFPPFFVNNFLLEHGPLSAWPRIVANASRSFSLSQFLSFFVNTFCWYYQGKRIKVLFFHPLFFCEHDPLSERDGLENVMCSDFPPSLLLKLET
jgi:hypothetical protein